MRFLLFSALILIVGCNKSDFLQDYPKPYQTPYHKSHQLTTGSATLPDVEMDILWVIDNSGSMQTYQNRVIQSSESFIKQFTTNTLLNWKMGLISTSLDEEPYMGFKTIVDNRSPDAVDQFNRAVKRLGTGGDSLAERTFDPVLKVLNNYRGWLRPNAYFAIVVVSDEPEQSIMSTQQFINQILKTYNLPADHFIVYGVFSSGSNDSTSQHYNEVVRATKGKIYSLDAADYGVALADIGQDLISKITVVEPTIMLDVIPRIGTIRVVYKNRDLTEGSQWTYNPQYNFIRIEDLSILDKNDRKIDVFYEKAE